MDTISFRTFSNEATRWFQIIYQDFDRDQRLLTIHLFKKAFQWQWFGARHLPNHPYYWKLFSNSNKYDTK